MNGASPKQLSAIIAFFIALLATSFVVLLSNFSLKVELQVVISFGAVFFFSFFLINYIFGEFIHEKIKLIYKTIYKVKSSTSRLKEIKGDVFTAVNKDVEDWASEYENQTAEFRIKEKFRREFIGNVSHELKTPIFNIQGYVLTLLEGGLEDDNINRRYLERVEKSVNRMISLVDDLDTITRIESNQLELKFQKINIIELSKEVIDSLETFANEQQIKVQFDKDYSTPIYVNCDRDKIFQVLSNLIVNSIKYGKEKGLTEIRFYRMEGNILIEISDNGLGIDAHHLSRLFERFYRVEESRSRDKGGSGLGLAIVKHIIEAHNQTINVRSTRNVGSTFSFTLAKA